MSILSDEIREAYAVAPRDRIVWYTVEMRHPAFEIPIRLVTGRRRGVPLVATLEASAPLNAGEAVQFEPFAFRFTPPGVDSNGPTPARAIVDNISGALIEKLDLTLTDNRPIEVTFRVFRDDDLSAPGDIVRGLFLTDVEVTSTRVMGELRYREVATQGFPLRRFDAGSFPALFFQQ
jgi:hypothetical protein